MRFLSVIALLGLAALGEASRNPMHVGKPHDWLHNKRSPWSKLQNLDELEQPGDAYPKRSERPEIKHHKRAGETIIPQNKNTTRYAVNGTALPEVHFDIGESYAGLMPIDDSTDRELYFWFFPSKNAAAKDEIVIWLNGGPGCSSLEGLLQENGPFSWQYGTFQPTRNPWTWVKLTNMIWVEYPVGVGFTQGKPSAETETAAAQEFLGFFKNFIDTFGLHGKKIYITGESYAGYYVPYIASAMYANGDKTYYDVRGTLMYDPSTSYNVIQEQIPALPFIQYHANLFPLNSTYLAKIVQADKKCGYADFREKYLVFPPPKIPTPPQVNTSPECDVFDMIINGILDINPCWDIYQVATTCPILWDVLGFPGSIPYQAKGSGKLYFNRKDVQKVINAPIMKWAECNNGVLTKDRSPPSGLSVLPGVIEKNERSIIGHGQLDMVLIANGTLQMIQNMTWNGKQGFQSAPASPFYVPFHDPGKLATLAGAGTFGVTHTERGLTWAMTYLSGHMAPQYAPSTAYRQLEFLLGRIPSLSSKLPFTTPPTHGGTGP